MTQENKELLLIDLCARLPYGVLFKGEYDEDLQEIHYIKDEAIYTRTYPHLPYWIETIKPYLRPLSSMTEEEKRQYMGFIAYSGNPNGSANFVDWLNEHHFDYRTIYDESKEKWVSMIEKGLALEAPKGMYNLKEK